MKVLKFKQKCLNLSTFPKFPEENNCVNLRTIYLLAVAKIPFEWY